MGVKGLTSLLQRLAPQSVNLRHISHYQGKTAAVDISCFLNRFIYGLDPHPARVQRGVYRLCVYLEINGIKPIFVFDGAERIPEKQRENERRRIVKEKILESFLLEKERKLRLRDLKSSAAMLKNLPNDTASSILEDFQLYSDVSTTPSALKQSSSLWDSESIGTLSLNSQEKELDDESMWHAPPLTDDEQRHLEQISINTKGAYDNVLQSHIHDHYEDSSSFDFETYVQERLMDDDHRSTLQHGLHVDMSDVDPTYTGVFPMSVDDVIQATDLEQAQLDDIGSSNDSIDESRIKYKVHKALLKFIALSEKEFGSESADETRKRFTRTQLELNILEQKLIQEIKDISLSNERRVDGNDGANNQNLIKDHNSQDNDNSENRMIDSLNEDQNKDTPGEEDKDIGIQATIKKLLSEHQTLLMSLGRRSLSVSKSLTISCQTLLRAMGQPVIVAKDSEAEAVCARMTALGITDISISEDTDTAVFGDGLLVRQVGVTGGKDIIEIDPVVARQSLGLSRESFRDMCILCGTDFSGTIEGIGPSKAAILIKRYGSIESIMANVTNQPRADFFYDLARRVFQRIPNVPTDLEEYSPKPADQPLLQELMLKYGINDQTMIDDIQREMRVRELATEEEESLGQPEVTNSLGIDPFKATSAAF